ncbi:MAG TPA: tyrosine-type recombinase/integrase [Ktedonobacteraceae bacterium]|nr:tyrosine-type recombinase/integrase [Ktedonobacteraceae bacterium]
MNIQDVKWKYYPHVAAQSAARSFIERLTLKGKRPKTIDAYARAIEDLLAYFSGVNAERVLEADEADLDRYIASLKQRGLKKRGRGGMIEDETKIRSLTGRKLSDNTIALRVVACRLFYEFLLRKNLRTDPVNPIARGNDGRDGQRPARGPVSKQQRLPWVPDDMVWERFIHHVLLHEDMRTQAMILLCYDAALRREELMSLRVDDIDWARGIITIRPETTKNGRMRSIPVEASVLHLVRRYIESHRRVLIAAYDGEDRGQIFVSESTRNPGCPLAVGAFDEIVERVREKVGLPFLTPHTLRHQRCTILKRVGISLDEIALFAGHKSIETTRLYIHLAPNELSQRIRAKVEPFDAKIRVLIEQAFLKEGKNR